MLMICSLPPPLTGQTLVNSALADRFQRLPLDFAVHDISHAKRRGVLYYLTRISRVGSAIARLLARSDRLLYLSSESRYGSIYLLIICFFARLKRHKIFIHHHVYSYINQYSFIHLLLIAMAGRRCTHVLLSNLMVRDFRARFGAERQCLTLHNSLFIPQQLRRRVVRTERNNVLNLGFIGRLEEAKGFDDYLALMARLETDQRFRFIVAGDHENTEYRERLVDLRERLGLRLQLFGFVGGERKAAFFESVNVLIFPSRYVNEASPMVCYEALAMGVPVIVTRVGAVEDIVDSSCGVVLERSDELVVRMAEEVCRLVERPSQLAEWQTGATARFAELERRGSGDFADLQERLVDIETGRVSAQLRT